MKYEFGADKQYAFIHSEDVAERDESSSATEATSRQSRQTTLYGRSKFNNGSMLELGGLISATEKIDDPYDRVEGDDIIVDEIEFEDTLGIKGKYAFDVSGSSRAYLGFNYAGLVADGGDQLTDGGTELPYSNMGNKQEIEGGIQFVDGNYTWYPRFLYRENLVDANPLIPPETDGTNLFPGVSPRDTDSDPFAVLDNREATSAELIFTYDPTPATYFYHWNADLLEDAPFAYNIGLTATQYGADTDAYLFFFPEGGTNASFGEGLDDEDVWLLKTKLIFNPRQGLKTIFNAQGGAKQSSGRPGQETVEFFSFDTKIVVDKTHIYSAIVRVDDFGPYDFQEQFNIVYPLQLELEYTRLLDKLRDEERSSQVGVVLFYRTLGESSPPDEYEDGNNDYMFELQTYFKVAF